jgi:glycosyltransferase involved in cell wall biosynthesis
MPSETDGLARLCLRALRKIAAPIRGTAITRLIRRCCYGSAAMSGAYVFRPPRPPRNLHRRLATLINQPLLSIVAVARDAPPHLLERQTASVLAQWYPNWELILVDDASVRHALADSLRGIADPRIRASRSAQRTGIAAATNAGLAQARGDYVIFLDQDDELTADCLYELALRINREDPDVVYSDEDEISPGGSLRQPFFKPDWSPDTIMSLMFARHVLCVRRTLLERLGGLRPEFEGSQDYDLVLRLAEITGRISHVPKVLYHARAQQPAAPPDQGDASRRVRVAALARRGLDGSVEPVPQAPGHFRVHYKIRGTPLISIIIPTRDNAEVLDRCVRSIVRLSTWRNFEIIVMDNGSVRPDAVETLRRLADHPCVTVISHDRPFNYSEINNAGARHARGELLLFLNDDTEVIMPDWLERMAGYAQLGHIGAAGAKLLYPGTRTIQHAGILNLEDGPSQALAHRDADDPGFFLRSLVEYNWIAVTGACLMIERAKFEAAGGFDEGLPIAYNDVKLCFDLLDAGLYNVTCSAVELLHYESKTRGLDHVSREKLKRLAGERKYLYEKHPHFFQCDPFYSTRLRADGAVRVD